MPASNFHPVRVLDPGIDTNSNAEWQTVQNQISWLLKKPTDLDLYCLQMQDISGFSRTRVNMGADQFDDDSVQVYDNCFPFFFFFFCFFFFFFFFFNWNRFALSNLLLNGKNTTKCLVNQGTDSTDRFIYSELGWENGAERGSFV